MREELCAMVHDRDHEPPPRQQQREEAAGHATPPWDEACDAWTAGGEQRNKRVVVSCLPWPLCPYLFW